MFQRMGSVKVLLNPKGSESQAEVLVDTALGAGAEDFEQSPSGDEMAEIEFSFLCQPPDLTKLTNAVTSLHPPHKLMSSELIYTSLEAVNCSDEIQGGLATLIEDLEEDEDTLRVWSNPSP
ncbi:hypothetical protein BD779DRAFT_1199543 [Infundibulicybe gibba]|nr:hypothetical protein BD779DRAFT_1199543 [Infundibulicybe gibba]